ncbi:MotE family protein [Roseivivax sp. CAU 1753]
MKLTRSQCLLALLGSTVVLRLAISTLPQGEATSPPTTPSSGFVGWAEAAESDDDPAPKSREPASVSNILANGCEIPEMLLDTIKEEQALIQAERVRLEERAVEIAIKQEAVDVKAARLEELRQELSGLLERAEARQTADLDRLVALYSAMKPADAARIMDDMDLEVTVMVLGTMRERDAAPILADLSDIRARAISKILLERAQLPGDQDLRGIKLR